MLRAITYPDFLNDRLSHKEGIPQGNYNMDDLERKINRKITRRACVAFQIFVISSNHFINGTRVAKHTDNST